MGSRLDLEKLPFSGDFLGLPGHACS